MAEEQRCLCQCDQSGVDLTEAELLIDKYRSDREATIALLQDVQQAYGYLPRPALDLIARELLLPETQLYGLATFYKAFSLKPRGRHLITVCMGTTCHVRGAPKLLDAIERTLGCSCGETTGDDRFSLEKVNCVGACARAPLMVIDGHPHGPLAPADVPEVLAQYP